MSIDFLREVTKKLTGTQEDIKWGHDLCFCIGEKMYCVTGLDGPFSASFKVRDDEFDELVAREGIGPAPYMARNKWVNVTNPSALKRKEWEAYVAQSYNLVAARLPKKLKEKLGII